MQLFKFFKTFLSFWIFGQQYYKNESIHQNSWHHSHKKQKDSLETQVVFVDIFAWTWNIWGRRKVNTSKQQKMVAFVKLFSENCFEAVLVNFCCYGLWCQCFRRLAQGYCWSSYATSLKQLAIYCLLIGDTSQVSVFSWQIKMNNLLHVGLILIISKVFTILCLLCLCRIGNSLVTFKTKQLSVSSFKWVTK